MEWIYANDNHSTIVNEKNGVIYLTFPKLAAAGVRHGFSTRMGGVSKGNLGTMNLSFTRGDREENVRENFRRIADAIGFEAKDLVFSAQIHETKLRKVTKENREREFSGRQCRVLTGLSPMSREFLCILPMRTVCRCCFMTRNRKSLPWLTPAGEGLPRASAQR